MKFLVKNLYLFFLINFLFSLECYEKWYEHNINVNNNFYEINANINNDSFLKIYTDNNQKYRLELSEKIIITDSLKTISYNKKNNQLYIENTDRKLSDLIFSFFDINMLKNKVKKTDSNYLKLKKNVYGNVHVHFNNKCTFIDSIIINRMKNKFSIKNISVNLIGESVNVDSLFTLDIDENEVFKYDLR